MSARRNIDPVDRETIAAKRALALEGAASIIAAAVPDPARLCGLLAIAGAQYGPLVREVLAATRPTPLCARVEAGVPDREVWARAADNMIGDVQ